MLSPSEIIAAGKYRLWIIDEEYPGVDDMSRVGRIELIYWLPEKGAWVTTNKERRQAILVEITKLPAVEWACCYDDKAADGEPEVCGRAVGFAGRHWCAGDESCELEIDVEISDYCTNDAGTVTYCEKVDGVWEHIS